MIDITLFAFLLVTVVMILRLRSLFSVVMLNGVFSLLSAGLFVSMDAVDVAFTEAAVGAGITTVLFLGALALTGEVEKPAQGRPYIALLVMSALAAMLIFGTADMPPYGSVDAPARLHVMPEYITGTQSQIGIPNMVSAILASYRGFDTLGEAGVIFTAGAGVLLLLRRRRLRRDPEREGGAG